MSAAMRIRKPFAGVFLALVLFAGYLGLAPITIPYGEYHTDKVLHFVTFFLVTLTFYWIFETTRRRTLNLSLVVCTGVLGVGSEILQAFLNNHREFDLFDIGFNVAGSLTAIALCAWYHRRMLERKRAAKGYRSGSGDEELGAMEGDVELDEGTGPQETGVTSAGQQRKSGQTIDEELDRWDENAEDDWDENEPGKANGTAADGNADGPVKKRDD